MPGKRKAFFSIDPLKRLGHDLFLDALGSFFFAIGIYKFAAPANFAPGGVRGISIIINHFTKLPIGILAFLLNIPLILMSMRVLGRAFLLRSLQTLVVNTIFLDLVSPRLPLYQGDPLLAALFAGAGTDTSAAAPSMVQACVAPFAGALIETGKLARC